MSRQPLHFVVLMKRNSKYGNRDFWPRQIDREYNHGQIRTYARKDITISYLPKRRCAGIDFRQLNIDCKFNLFEKSGPANYTLVSKHIQDPWPRGATHRRRRRNAGRRSFTHLHYLCLSCHDGNERTFTTEHSSPHHHHRRKYCYTAQSRASENPPPPGFHPNGRIRRNRSRRTVPQTGGPR